MRRYIDQDVRTALAFLVGKSSYRRVSAAFGLEFSHLYRMVNGERPVTEQAAAAVGFVPLAEPQRWVRRLDGVSRKAVK